MYEDISFSNPKNRPFFYTSFAATVDGKVFVQKKGYWPIGSKIDYEVFTFLRAHADVIIDGKGTALQFGRATIDTIHKKEFIDLRTSLGKSEKIQYIVMTKSPDEELKKTLDNQYNYQPMIFTKGITQLLTFLQEKKYQAIFIDGGPTLLGSFLEEGLINEIFLTISPKIFGNTPGSALTLVEGVLFPKEKIKHLRLLSTQQVGDELFLRYRVQS